MALHCHLVVQKGHYHCHYQRYHWKRLAGVQRMLTNGLFHMIMSFSSCGDTLGWDGAQVGILKQAPGRPHWPPAERENRKFNVVSSSSCKVNFTLGICFEIHLIFSADLQSSDGCPLETQLGLEVLCDFLDQAFEVKLANQQLGGLLVMTDVA